ncbi:hypothetical protein BUALT_Bualt02G0240200 [Buddleja alternifolia]|uniref:Uncharacterized protein n=1 Tax=Buddleja alternifolia TaxID=168488 RepID=A0AAV6YDH5_9LAMI|nr:hypothetical protein BUALT_Bualt02G0240200 [Buddleja alternifolia]
MSKKSSLIARRAWKILRLALLWARKGGMFRSRIEINLNVLIKGIRKLCHTNETRGALAYGDHEFSFDETPMMHVKMHRPSYLRFKMPHIPCIKPQVDFDYSFEFDEDVISVNEDTMCYSVDHVQRTGFLKDDSEDEEEEEMYGACDEGIDLKAEKFIAKFYEQIKQQRLYKDNSDK